MKITVGVEPRMVKERNSYGEAYAVVCATEPDVWIEIVPDEGQDVQRMRMSMFWYFSRHDTKISTRIEDGVLYVKKVKE